MSNAYNKKTLSVEERNYLVSLLDNHFLTYMNIIAEFNNKYPTNAFNTRGGFLCYLKREGLYRRWQPTTRAFNNQEELDYIIELMKDETLTWREIALKFWNKYRTGKMPASEQRRIQERMTKTHKIRRPDNLVNDGKFTSERNRTRLPLGTEVKKKFKDGTEYTWIKVADKRGKNQTERNKIYRENWRPKQDVIWEKYYNDKVKESELVIFLDGNVENFDINNLKKITRKTNATLAKYQAHNSSEFTSAMIDVIETDQIIKQIDNERR